MGVFGPGYEGKLGVLVTGCYSVEERDGGRLSPLGLCSSNDVGRCRR